MEFIQQNFSVAVTTSFLFGVGVTCFINSVLNKSKQKIVHKLKQTILEYESKPIKTIKVGQNSKDVLTKYIEKFGMFQNDKHLDRIKSRSLTMEDGGMMADTVACQFMSLINLLINSKTHVEVGVFTGYNLLQQALQLKENNPDNNFMCYAMDTTVGYFFFTRHHFAEAKIKKDNVKFMHNPAINSLETLLEEKDLHEKVDSVFIDADKYLIKEYYDKAVQLVRKGGVIFIDNVIWSGRVAEYAINGKEYNDNEKTKRIHAMVEYVNLDERVRHVILPFGDGLLMAVKL